jgi:hypothetical protein
MKQRDKTEIAESTYPGVYSGIMTFFPNIENVYPMVAAAASDCASTICGRLRDGPDGGCFMKSEITITVVAIPITTTTFARNGAPGVVDSISTPSIISFTSPPPAEGPVLDIDAFAVLENRQNKLCQLFLFSRILIIQQCDYHIS